MKKIILSSIAILAALTLGACSNTESVAQGDPTQMSETGSGRISVINNSSFDWGDINIEGGDVEHEFTLKNVGDEDLIIKSANTTCMCTTAVVETQDGISPTFAMHGSVPWGVAVKPNEEFTVKVIFDPMAHGPSATGPIQRSVYLYTSSKPNAQFAQVTPESDGSAVTELRVAGDVLSKADYEQKKGDFAFVETEFDFGILKQSGGIVTHDFAFEYIGEDPISVTATPTSCACTTAEISQKEFEKGDKGTLTVAFDPNLHEEPEGHFFKTVSLVTEPKLEKQPEVKIWAEIDLDLGPEAYKLQGEHNEDEDHL
ncbi:MAG: DUF1573 domain-containing protein [Candidatus Gracilibacteria bacterium]|nr:DUF1573 domain-containing protein [Candidatus Peregrinibacteria bacterium]